MYWAYFYDRPDSRKAAYRFHVPELDSFLEPERWEHDPEYGSTYRTSPIAPPVSSSIPPRLPIACSKGPAPRA